MLSTLLIAGLLFGVPAGLEPIDDTPWIVVEAPSAAEACCFLIDFEDAAPGECLNDRYRTSHGIAFDRPDSACIAAVDWSARGAADADERHGVAQARQRRRAER